MQHKKVFRLKRFFRNNVEFSHIVSINIFLRGECLVVKKYFVSLLLCILTFLSFSCVGFCKERLYSFSNTENNIISEINYYLDNGATVKQLNTTEKSPTAIIITVVLNIPDGIPPYSK